MRLPGPVRDTSLHVAHAVGEGIDRQVRNHHRRRLRKVGWEHAFDGERAGWARDAMEPREGNRAEVLIDGANVLPRMAEDIAAAESHVHLIGWHFSPELDLTRGETADDPPQPPRRARRARRGAGADVEGLAAPRLPSDPRRRRHDAPSLCEEQQDRVRVGHVRAPVALPPREDDRDRRPDRLRRRHRPDARRRRSVRHVRASRAQSRRLARRGDSARGPDRRRRRGALPDALGGRDGREPAGADLTGRSGATSASSSCGPCRRRSSTARSRGASSPCSARTSPRCAEPRS